MDSLDKKYYRIREVADMLGLPLSTLRFWEQRFTVVSPRRNEHGTRMYTPKDVETIATIHYLVKERGLKLDAAQELIHTNPQLVSRKAAALRRLRQMRDSLVEMIQTLDRRAH